MDNDIIMLFDNENPYIYEYSSEINSQIFCIICYEEIEDRIYKMYCMNEEKYHNVYYHKDCIKEWIKDKKRCPCCNVNLHWKLISKHL
jgi:hypothetical protein